jgi:peptidoglycan/LPS O-acetylase OafA/YrhL
MLLTHSRRSVPSPPDVARGVARNGRLDELRGIAALCVVLHHAESAFHVAGPFGHGYLAVDFFFLLSGYLLGIAYETRLSGGLSALEFMRLRVLRLWPVLSIGLLLGALFLLLGGGTVSAVAILLAAQISFVPFTLAGSGIFPLIGVQWSLWFELQANLLHCTILRHLRLPAMIGLVTGSAALLIGVSFHLGTIAVGDIHQNWWGGYGRVGFSYGLGYLLSRPMTLAHIHALPISPSLAPLVPGALLLAIAGSGQVPSEYSVMTDLIVVLLVFPFLLVISVGSENPPTDRGSSILGFLSYPLYAIHIPLIGFTVSQGSFDAPMLRAGQMLVTALVILVLAYLVAVWLEPRAARAKARR